MISTRSLRGLGIVCMVGLLALADGALARPFFRQQPTGAGGAVNLPYSVNDNAGNIWQVYNNGWIQQQGNMPLYSQGAVISVNGNQPNQPNNQGRMDEATGELVLENMIANGVSVTRRILLDKDEQLIRYIDIIHNTQNQEQTFNISLQSNLNFGVNAAQFVADPKKKDQNLAWVAQTGAGRSVVEIYAGKGSKNAPVLNWPQGSNTITTNLTLIAPAGRELAFLHLHKIVPTQEAGVAFVTNFKETALMKTIPPALRRIIVNFPNPQGWIGDVELLRGDVLDVVELHSGDQFRGTLQETAFSLQTFYGPLNVPIDNVVGIINTGQFRPRQLLVTSDGQIFGGRLKKPTLDLQLSSGQITQIPLGQVSRAGYRKRTGESEEWTFDRPMVMLRSGERMNIKPLTNNLDVVTRYGKLAVSPSMIAAISFQNEENGVHEIFLIDGSKFSGLLSADAFGVTLDTASQNVSFPPSAMLKLQLAPKMPELDELSPTLRLSNEDLLVGTLTGKLELETAFDTIGVAASEIRSMTRAKESVQDVQVVLWDGTSLSGQLQSPDLGCQLGSGLEIKVPVALLEEYIQPQPRPSPSMIEKIKGIIADLNADDWKQRDRAQAALIAMGPVAAGAMKELRAKQPPEAQKAIDIILQKFEEVRKRERPAGGHAATPPSAPPQPNAQLQLLNKN